MVYGGPAPTPEDIAYGDTVVGQLTSANYDLFYKFEGEAGDVIRVVLTPSGPLPAYIRPTLVLMANSRHLYAENDSYEESATLVYKLQSNSGQDNEYLIGVIAPHPHIRDYAVEFELTLEKLPEQADCEATDSKPDRDFSISYEDDEEGTFQLNLELGLMLEYLNECDIDLSNYTGSDADAAVNGVTAVNDVLLEDGKLKIKVNTKANGLYSVVVEAPEFFFSFNNDERGYTSFRRR